MKNYVGSDEILKRIKEYETRDAAGLSGFILLLHIGTAPERTDKFYNRLNELIVWLKSRNYELVRIDRLLLPQRKINNSFGLNETQKAKGDSQQ